jgi:hypothetical protein
MRNWLHGHWASFVSNKGPNPGQFKSQRSLKTDFSTGLGKGDAGRDNDNDVSTSSVAAGNDDDDDDNDNDDDSSEADLDLDSTKGRRRSVIILDRLANVGKTGGLSSSLMTGACRTVHTFSLGYCNAALPGVGGGCGGGGAYH